MATAADPANFVPSSAGGSSSIGGSTGGSTGGSSSVAETEPVAVIYGWLSIVAII